MPPTTFSERSVQTPADWFQAPAQWAAEQYQNLKLPSSGMGETL
jgi:hypothetical protein